MKMLAGLLLAGSLSAVSLPAGGQTPPPPPPAEAKTTASAYVKAAGMSDLYEIDSSKIAVQKSKSPAVRRLAEMLIRHHQQTTAATVKAAGKAGLNPPPPALDAGHSASIAELQSASAADFDRLYLAQQVPAHQAALDLHRSYAANGDQAPLRMSAKAAVPIVEQHLKAAQALQAGDHGAHKGM
ncbi:MULTISPECIES: DUF4142 domain-containing protein [unclassified Sphingobium]|uniref:DUF4142 domain-containing protein n=1 Tax=unclassified Sphingobium TaxID=2611147 RepID=UPI0035A584F4